jgi:hypothetical protein
MMMACWASLELKFRGYGENLCLPHLQTNTNVFGNQLAPFGNMKRPSNRGGASCLARAGRLQTFLTVAFKFGDEALWLGLRSSKRPIHWLSLPDFTVASVEAENSWQPHWGRGLWRSLPKIIMQSCGLFWFTAWVVKSTCSRLPFFPFQSPHSFKDQHSAAANECRFAFLLKFRVSRRNMVHGHLGIVLYSASLTGFVTSQETNG